MFQAGPHDGCLLVEIGSASVVSAVLQPSHPIGGNSLDPDCTLAANQWGELANMKQIIQNDYFAKDSFKHPPRGNPDKCMSTALKLIETTPQKFWF